MRHTANIKLAKDSIVADVYDSIAICERKNYQEVLVPSVGDISFAPSTVGRTLFLGSSDGAFRMFVNSFSEVHLTARPYLPGQDGPQFTYVVSVKGTQGV